MPTFDSTLSEIKAMGLPEIFASIWVDRSPVDFALIWSAPYAILDVWDDVILRVTELADAIPLLERLGDRLLGYDTAGRTFFEYDYTNNEFIVIGETYQQFLSWLFIDLCREAHDQTAIRVVPAFKYEHLQALKEFAAGRDLYSEEARRKFVDAHR